MVKLAKHKRRMILFKFVRPSVKASFHQNYYSTQNYNYYTQQMYRPTFASISTD